MFRMTMMEKDETLTPHPNPTKEGLEVYFAEVEVHMKYMEVHEIIARCDDPLTTVLPMATIVTQGYIGGYSTWRTALGVVAMIFHDFVWPQMTVCHFFDKLAEALEAAAAEEETKGMTRH